MSEGVRVRVAVDSVGGDRAPEEIVGGVVIALQRDPMLEVLLTGPHDTVTAAAESHSRIKPHPTTQVIAMDEHPAQAVRSKRDSSIVVGCRLVKEKQADAFFSAGSTGACMAAATLFMGRLRGVVRPAIATIIPTAGRPAVLLDVGANADCTPEHLLQFGHMGSSYAKTVLGVTRPRVGLLNIGEEPSKGSILAIEAHRLMLEDLPGFIGNVEGRDIPAGEVDVIVTDGFTGNVALKLLEGTTHVLLREIKTAMTSTPLRTAAAAVLAPSLRELKARLNPDAYGGAPLLGVDGVCIIGHGSSGREAVAGALTVATTAVRGQLTDHIARGITGTARS